MAHMQTQASLVPCAPVRVEQVLRHSRAHEERRVELGDGLSLVQWSNAFDRTRYSQPGHHTLSVYLEGGWDTTLEGLPGVRGAPGCHCLLPSEHESRWQVGGPQRFVHLYWSGPAWAERVVRVLDGEPRALSLATRILAQDPRLAAWSRQVAALDWTHAQDRLQVHALCHGVLDSLLLESATPAQRGRAERFRGGLSGAARRQVLEYIDAHLDASGDVLRLGALAQLVHLSEFHFARMFRASMGCSVQDWIGLQRLHRAQTLLADRGLAIADVAWRCGYASPSHLSHSVKRATGLTPRQLRAALSR